MIYQFCDMIGQAGSITLLQRSLAKGNFPKVTILSGVHGTGKSTAALISAMAYTCEHPNNGEPCLNCNSCKAILKASKTNWVTRNFIKVNMPERINKQSFEQLLKEIFVLQVSEGKCVYVLEEMHAVKDRIMQTALLERIDAMPDNVIIIMTTTELSDLIQPLQSRARVFRFSRINQRESENLVFRWCQQHGVGLSKKMEALLIKTAKGVPRDLISLLDFVTNNDVTFEELTSYLNLIDVDDIISLFLATSEVQASSGIAKLDALLKKHECGIVIVQIKEFVLDAIYFMEGNIHGIFSRSQETLVHECFDGVQLIQIASILDKLGKYSSDIDVKFAFLRIRQVMTNKKLASIVTGNKKAAAIQQRASASIIKDKEAVEHLAKNDTQKMDRQAFLDTMSLFGGGNK